MKKYGILFFELALIILLFTFTTDAADFKHYRVGEEGVHVAWDPTPKPRNISKDSEIRYCVYISKTRPNDPEPNDKEGAVLAKKSVKNEETPIADTSCTIEIPATGEEFVIGVQTVIYVEEKPVVCNPKIINTENRSDIAWSDKEINTKYYPFGAMYGQH